MKKDKENINIKTADEVLRSLSPQERKAGENVMRQCLAIKENEKVVVVADALKTKEAAIFFETAKRFAKEVILVEMAPRTQHGEEPPKEVTQVIFKSDAAFFVTTKSLSHTQARRKAIEKGIRIASMPGITTEMICRTLAADYTRVAQLTKKVARFLSQAKKAKITTKRGTNLVMSLHGRKSLADTGIFVSPGDWGNLPSGEACLAPVEGTTKGIAIIDGCSFFDNVPLDKPIKLEIKRGMVVRIQGGKAAKALKKAIEKVGLKATNIAELGIGTNEKATLSSGSPLEVEKVYGTIHIALGNNLSYGGKVDVPFHVDGVILKPTLILDGKTILKDGKFKI